MLPSPPIQPPPWKTPISSTSPSPSASLSSSFQKSRELHRHTLSSPTLAAPKSASPKKPPIFSPTTPPSSSSQAIPWPAANNAGIAHADADLFLNNTYALIGASADQTNPRISAFVKILEKIGARPLWLGAQQHDYAVGLASHLPQLASVALASFLYDHLDENGLPITLAGPGLRDSLRLAGSPYSTWRDIVLTNKEVLSASLDLFARRLDDLRERLASRDLEADFDAANELYKLLRSL